MTLEVELGKDEASGRLDALSVADKVVQYNAANRTVAILCNHQRTVPKGMAKGLEDMNEKLALYKEQRAELQKMLARVEAGKSLKSHMLKVSK